MPSINLRLTDEEHAALERWARGAHRSLQREIIFRLFSERTEADAPTRDDRVEPTHGGPAGRSSQAVQSSARPVVTDPHFKPDFK